MQDLNLVDNHCLQYHNGSQWIKTTSEISKWGTFSPFLSLIVLLLVLPSNLIVSAVKS